MNRPLSENCRALDLGFDVRLISPISGVEQFPRTHGESDIISGLSGHGDANITDDVSSIRNLMNMNYDIKR